jgi:tetratricopeptide (TPR) repeat protein
MNPWKMTPLRWLCYFGLVVVFFLFILAFDPFDDGLLISVGVGMPLTLVVGVGAYLARPSVRETIAFYIPLYYGNRALIRGEFEQAERYYGTAVARAESFRWIRDASLGTALCQLAEVHRVRGQLAEAEPIHLRALWHAEAAARSAKTGSEALWRNREIVALNLSAVYINQGRYDEAEPLCRDALAALKSDPAGGDVNRAVAMHNLGLILSARGRHGEAEELLREAVERVGRRMTSVSSGVWVLLSSLAEHCLRQGHCDQAERLARRALTLAEKSVYGPKHPYLSRYLNVLAETVRQQGRLDEAEALCLRSQALTEKAFGPNHLRLGACLATLARIRITQGQPAAAEPLLCRCLAILDAVVVADHPDRLLRRGEYAALLRQLGRPAEAASWDKETNANSRCEVVRDSYARR